SGEAVHEGRLFRVTLSTFEESRLNTPLIRQKMKPGWLKRFSLAPRTINKVSVKARIGVGLEEAGASAAA
ncbi:MAG TPA: hypothetical protein VKU84_01825, partial [Stellaceae bacterium]|nr:hypothetical protein [Stellaceae bacterium]